MTHRIATLGIVASIAVGLSTISGSAQTVAAPDQVRIGYQKSSTLTAILKANGELEKALAPLGVRVSWHEFTSGLPLLEAINTGNIDFGADVADTVPLFAQAAGAKLAYIAEARRCAIISGCSDRRFASPNAKPLRFRPERR
jgi:sulfonate transport system substrate-binding protein